MPRIITPDQYNKVLNGAGCDFCDCCGGKYSTDAFCDGYIRDLDNPIVGGGYPLLGTPLICPSCYEDCDEIGPCKPDNLVVVLPERLILAETTPEWWSTFSEDEDGQSVWHVAEGKSVMLKWLSDNGFASSDGVHYTRPVEQEK